MSLRLAAGVGGRPRIAVRQGEGADPRPRRYGGRAPADGVDGRGEGVPLQGTNRPAGLADLFEGRRQLIVYRAFYAPDVTTYPASGGAYPERACVGCSFGADQVAHPAHLNARDTTPAYVSHAPQAEQGLKERMGWQLISSTPAATRT